MKAYKKWLSGHYRKTVNYPNPGDEYNAGAKQGWRAALECAKDHECCDSQGCQYMIDELENK